MEHSFSSISFASNELPRDDLEDVDVIALSPTSLMAKNRFSCDVCNKGFNREQNLQLHRRGHNLPWNLKAKGPKQVKRKVYLCPEPSCPHNDPSRALGDLSGLKKHFLRKHGEKKHECEKCNKKYAVRSDYNAHLKTCRKRSYACDCGTVFSRRDSFIGHRTRCALAREAARNFVNNPSPHIPSGMLLPQQQLFQVPFDSNASYAESSSYANSLNFGFVPGNAINYTSGIDSHKFGFGEVPFGVLPPNQTTEQLPFDSNTNEAGPSSFASFHNSSFFPDNGSNYTSAIDSTVNYAASSSYANSLNFCFVPDHGINYIGAIDSHQFGFGEESFNPFSSGNYTSTLPKDIQNPSTAQLSFTTLLQSDTQFGSTSSTSRGATNPQQTCVDPYNADKSVVYGDNGTGQLQDIENSVARGSSSSRYGGTYHDRDMEAQYFAHKFNESLAAFRGEGTWFSRLNPNAGPARGFITNVGGVGMSSLDLQAGNTGTSGPSQHFGDPNF